MLSCCLSQVGAKVFFIDRLGGKSKKVSLNVLLAKVRERGGFPAMATYGTANLLLKGGRTV